MRFTRNAIVVLLVASACALLAGAVAPGHAQVLTSAQPATPTAADGAIALWIAGRYAEALTEFQKVVAANPASPTTHTKFVKAAAGVRAKAATLEFQKKRAAAAKRTEAARKAAGDTTGAAAQPPAEAPYAMPPVLSDEQLAKMEKEVDAANAALSQLVALYTSWAAERPSVAIYPFELALLADPSKDPAEGERLLLRAVSLDPKLTEAYVELIRLNNGVDEAAAAKYARMALDTRPDDDKLQFDYARMLWPVDHEAARKFYRQLIDRNAGTPKGSSVLLQFISTAEDPEDKLPLIEELRRSYPSAWSSSSSFNGTVFEAYVTRDPVKGLAFAQEVLAGLERNKPSDQKAAANADRTIATWKTNGSYAQAIVDARGLIAQKKGADATALLEKVALPPVLEDSRQLELVKAEAVAAAGDTTKAYEMVAAGLVKDMDEDLEKAAVTFGAKVGKSAKQVDDDIWTRRVKNAETFKDFDLAKLGSAEHVKLSDLRGKVILVDFWFPG
jgi:tetratricopeptide (TPR) repeat protein